MLGSHRTLPGGFERGKYRYLDGPCSSSHQLPAWGQAYRYRECLPVGIGVRLQRGETIRANIVLKDNARVKEG